MSEYFLKCRICNKDIIAKGPNKKYCSSCAKKVKSKQDSDNQQKYIGGEKIRTLQVKDEISRIENSNARLFAIVAAADKAGMHYSDYVAKMREKER